MSERIARLYPRTAWAQLDIIIAEQAAYYGDINAHVVAWLIQRAK